jgi:hypothetical protein
MSPPSNKLTDEGIKQIARWIALFGVSFASFFALCAFIYIFASDISLLRQLIQDNPQAIIGLPVAALNSYCLVIFLEASSGPIEFEALSFKFRGASGPLVLWIFVFLAMVAGIKILWIPN